jgi:hypothetical protein
MENLSRYKFIFGKYKDRELNHIQLVDLDFYLAWLEDQDNLGYEAKKAKVKLREYLVQPEIAEALERELDAKGE